MAGDDESAALVALDAAAASFPALADLLVTSSISTGDDAGEGSSTRGTEAAAGVLDGASSTDGDGAGAGALALGDSAACGAATAGVALSSSIRS
jgi:hypothetical protein